MTVDRVHVLATPGMDAHSSYVALSRHRDGVGLHTPPPGHQLLHLVTNIAAALDPSSGRWLASAASFSSQAFL